MWPGTGRLQCVHVFGFWKPLTPSFRDGVHISSWLLLWACPLVGGSWSCDTAEDAFRRGILVRILPSFLIFSRCSAIICKYLNKLFGPTFRRRLSTREQFIFGRFTCTEYIKKSAHWSTENVSPGQSFLNMLSIKVLTSIAEIIPAPNTSNVATNRKYQSQT